MYGAAFLVFIIVRIIMAARAGDGAQTPGTRTIFFVLLRWLVAAVIVGLTLEERSPPLLLLVLLLVAPSAFIVLAVTLGVPLLPYWLTRVLRPWSAAKENRAAAVFWELRARLRSGLLLGPARVQALADSIFLMSEAPAARGYTLAAQAMIDALHGNVAQARALFNLALDFKHNGHAVRTYAHAWLLADAAARGSYVEVLRLCARGPFSMRRLLLKQCAEHLLFIRQRSALRLRLSWLLAPGRLHTRALLRACREATRSELTPLGHDLPAAFEGAARLVAAPAGTFGREELERIAALWQGMLDDGTLRAHLLSRMAEQGSGFDLEQALASVEEQIVSVLADALEAASPSQTRPDDELERPQLLLSAEDRLRDELLRELESLTGDIETGESPCNADIESLFRRWAEIRWLAQRYLDLFPHGAETFYDNFGTALLNHGAWLHNQASAYPFACDVCGWLIGLLPADHEDLPLLNSNAKLSHTAASNQ